MTAPRRRTVPAEAGAAAVEFALVLPLLLLLLGFLLYGALFVGYTAVAEHAALAAERAAILRQPDGSYLACPTFDPASGPCRQLQRAAAAADLGLLPAPSVTTAQRTLGAHPEPGDTVTVSVRYTAVPGLDAVRSLLAFLPGVVPDHIRHAASGRLE